MRSIWSFSICCRRGSRIPAVQVDAVIYLVANLLLLPGLFPIEPLITVAWSLSCEMAYYIAIPLIVAGLRLRDRPRLARVLCFVGLAALIAVLCAAFGVPVRLMMFVAGILLVETMQVISAPSPSSLTGTLALILDLVVVWLPPVWLPASGTAAPALKISILFVCFFIVCLACFRRPDGWFARGLSWTPLRWLGNMSYSYYLLHGLALKVAFMAVAALVPVNVGDGVWMFWLLMPVLFAATLPPAALLFLAVERPFSLVTSSAARACVKSAGVLTQR